VVYMDNREPFTSLKVRRDTWSRVMENRRQVTRGNGVKAWETVDEVLRRLLGVESK
jgi:hypothetical protein